MRNKTSVVLVATCSLLSSLASAQPVAERDASVATARRAFDQGLVHFNSGEFDAAIADFEAAQRNKAHPSVLFNLGRSYAAARRPLEAIANLKRYLADAGATLPKTRLDTVNALIAEQESLLGTLRVSNNDPGIEVSVDGINVGTTPLSPISIAPGNHTVLATRAGYLPAVIAVQVRAGQVHELQLGWLTPPAEPVPEPTLASPVVVEPERRLEPDRERASPRPSATDKPSLSRAGLATFSVGIAALGFGTYASLRAHASWADRQRHCVAGICDSQAVDAWQDAKRFIDRGKWFME